MEEIEGDMRLKGIGTDKGIFAADRQRCHSAARITRRLRPRVESKKMLRMSKPAPITPVPGSISPNSAHASSAATVGSSRVDTLAVVGVTERSPFWNIQ